MAESPELAETGLDVAEHIAPREPRAGQRVAAPHAWYSGSFYLLATLATVAALALTFTWGVPPSARICFWVGLVLCSLGITVGYHRLFAHRAFETSRVLEWLFAILGSVAGQGGVLWWVATHREHHQFSDQPGDPHSPYVTRQGTPLGYWAGLWHAHIRWLKPAAMNFDPHFVQDLEHRPGLSWIHRHWFALHLAGLVIPAAVVFAIERTAYAALMGVLYGGFFRFFVTENFTFLVNSVAHRWGQQPHAVRDGSRNNWFVGILSFGEGWHNNHHAFPNSAALGHRWWQIDLGWALIVLLEQVGLVWNVRRPGPRSSVRSPAASVESP